MSLKFPCLGFLRKDADDEKPTFLRAEGCCQAGHPSGVGMGLSIQMPKGKKGRHCDLIPAADFCEIIAYFLTNYDLTDNDPRLKLLARLRMLRVCQGHNGPKSQRLEFD